MLRGVHGLQIEDDWLYYQCLDRSGIKRLHLETEEIEIVRDKPCGEYVIYKDKIYTNASDGFCSMELDGTNKVTIRDQSIAMVSQQISENKLWLGNSLNDGDGEWLAQGYLLGYDEIQNKWYLVRQNANYPLVTGNWLSVWDSITGTRKVWDLETNQETDLCVGDQRSVSNGEYLYYCEDLDGLSTFYRWDGENQRELFRIEEGSEQDRSVKYKYLTPDALYWLQSALINGIEKWELWYYDLETEEIGQIY